MKIITYNVNGVRAALGKGLSNWISDQDPDIICLQEIKASLDVIPRLDFEMMGYHTFWYPAQKKGYSGVAILSKAKPDHVEYGMGIDIYDAEGRFIRADYGDLSVVSVYHPSGSSGDERQAFKMQWLNDFLDYTENLKLTRSKLILSGDYNICHKPIDIHDPVGNAKSSGFLPEERAWMDTFVNNGYIDTFREFNNQPQQYSWWSFRANARAKNLGWRIDYHFASSPLKQSLSSAQIIPDAMHSDHCPVQLELDL